MAGTYQAPVAGGDRSGEEPKVGTFIAGVNGLLSGNNKLDGGSIEPGTVVNAGISASAAIAYSKLATMSTGAVLLGNAGTPTATTLSGDATVSATGVVSLTSPNNVVYKTILQDKAPIIGSLGAATYTFGSEVISANTANPTVVASGANLRYATGNVYPQAPALLYLVGADYSVASLTTKVRVRAQCVCNATAPGVNFTVGLYPVTVAGTAGNLAITLGTVVAGSTVTFTTPSASTVNQNNSGDLTIPSDGAYAFGVVLSGANAANNATVLEAQLQVRNV